MVIYKAANVVSFLATLLIATQAVASDKLDIQVLTTAALKKVDRQYPIVSLMNFNSAKLFATKAPARYTVAVNQNPAVLNINIDTQPVTADTFRLVDFKQTLIKLTSKSNNPQAVWNMDTALIFLAKQMASTAVVAGLEIDSQLPLSASAVHELELLAKKAVFISMKSSLAVASDWEKIFAAEQQNKLLLTTVYGPASALQIQSSPSLGARFAQTGVAFSHIYTVPGVNQANANQFWDAVAVASKKAKQPTMVIILSSGDKVSLDYAAIVNSSVESSDGYLAMVGGDKTDHFVPGDLSGNALVVWRQADNTVKGFRYLRADSPESLYVALGVRKPAFSILSFLADRSQKAVAAGVNLLADAENNFHTYGVLLDFANMVVINGDNIILPAITTSIAPTKLNLMVFNPSESALKKMLVDAGRLKLSITDQQYLGIFDFSTQNNVGFYQVLSELLSGISDIKFTYNAYNRSNFTNFQKMLAANTHVPVAPASHLTTTMPSLPTGLPGIPSAPTISSFPVTLNVVEESLSVNGKKARVYNIVQPDGMQGLNATKGEYFNVILSNKTSVPVSIHWHGLVMPNKDDGVPYVTQLPIQPGQSQQYYFKLNQAGTFWMHSHYKLYQQELMAAPLIIQDQADSSSKEVTVMLQDFTFKSPATVMSQLKQSAKKMTMQMNKKGQHSMRDLNDVKYDILLANRRTLRNPSIISVLPGQKVRLRVINASSASNYWLNTGKLKGIAIAVDGENISPFEQSKFQLALAQRMDIEVTIPENGGAFPILAQVEGTNKQTGVILATADAKIPSLSEVAASVAPALNNAQEFQLHAEHPLPSKQVNKVLTYTLGGNMKDYVWTINNQVWPKIQPLHINKGERVEMVFRNDTDMAHPMHFHGHVFQVAEIAGKPTKNGPLRDTILVLPHSTERVIFDAMNPGIWMLHCHVLYHQEAGMMTTTNYQGYVEPSYYRELISGKMKGMG